MSATARGGLSEQLVGINSAGALSESAKGWQDDFRRRKPDLSNRDSHHVHLESEAFAVVSGAVRRS